MHISVIVSIPTRFWRLKSSGKIPLERIAAAFPGHTFRDRICLELNKIDSGMHGMVEYEILRYISTPCSQLPDRYFGDFQPVSQYFLGHAG